MSKTIQINAYNSITGVTERKTISKFSWIFDKDLTNAYEIELLTLLTNDIHVRNESKENDMKVLRREISRKIDGYKYQDVAKELYDETKFVDFSYVCNLLINTNCACYYCKQPVKCLYQKVRDSLQWTLDRIDNDYGHNKENVYICCLKCNITRKVKHHENYKVAKQMKVVKIGHEVEDI